MAFKNKDRFDPGTGGRLDTLDLLRGATLISMILYHGMWDFIYLSETGGRMSALKDWYRGPGGFFWQQSICWTFILLSGFCVPFSRHIFRRGLQVSAAGLAVSAVTLLWMYDERVVWGVLSFLGAAMLLSGAARQLSGRKGSNALSGTIEEKAGSAGNPGSSESHMLSASKEAGDCGRNLRAGGRGRALAGFVLCCILFNVFRISN